MHPRLSWLAFWGACLGILIVMLLPASQLSPSFFSVNDKLEHLAAFTLLYCLGQALYAKHKQGLILGLLLFGAAIELAQSAIGWRTGDWRDWLANAAGLGLGALISIAWKHAYFAKIGIRAGLPPPLGAHLPPNSPRPEPGSPKREDHPPRP